MVREGAVRSILDNEKLIEIGYSKEFPNGGTGVGEDNYGPTFELITKPRQGTQRRTLYRDDMLQIKPQLSKIVAGCRLEFIQLFDRGQAKTCNVDLNIENLIILIESGTKILVLNAWHDIRDSRDTSSPAADR